ncbi:hypothetical protein [Paenibacillus nasutitermitis]|uniref:Sporulation membrane protein YtrI C-terminal domain-containing protein n=1 Tax=Paenibacillus nasutitermitis TaxID=1652958 RepID=A0A916Z393_9BACL|nr:hypothetical protein [Paenibacillus nasutitermitis]GGD74166.1 hypothetical protein GCM10010911_35090 [Paenibacillus nasutitermitis]
MRVPQFERYARLSQGAALLVVGAIIGAAVYQSIFFMNFNALKNVTMEMEDRLQQYEDDIKRLNQFKDQHTVIKSIQPVLEQAREKTKVKTLDELTKAELKRRIKEDLGVLIGRSIYDIDSDAKLARLLLERKVYMNVHDGDYVVEIKTMLVVDNMLRVWFTTQPLELPPR